MFMVNPVCPIQVCPKPRHIMQSLRTGRAGHADRADTTSQGHAAELGAVLLGTVMLIVLSVLGQHAQRFVGVGSD